MSLVIRAVIKSFVNLSAVADARRARLASTEMLWWALLTTASDVRVR